MRYRLIINVGALFTVASTVILDAQTPGRPSANSSRDRYALEVQVPIRRHGGGGGRSGRMFFAVEYETVPYPDLFPGEPAQGPAAPGMLSGGAETGGPEHINVGHLVTSASHPLAHAPSGVDGGDTSILHTDAASAPRSDDAGSPTVQPDPTANPYSARPPGAGGPGRPVVGWSGPGLPGPGQPARPRP
jgi:hypothetical protein